MYEILEELPEKHVTPTRVMTLVSVRCLNCATVQTLLLQNVTRANRGKRRRCAHCRFDACHYMTGTRFYRIWRGILYRTTDPSSKDYPRYGGVGRGVCESWLRFENFYQDMLEGYSDDLTIDREDNTLGYCKANCRWVPNMVQQSNKNNNRVVRYQGRDMHLAEFCRTAGVTRGAITPYLNKGLDGDEAVAAYSASAYPRFRAPR